MSANIDLDNRRSWWAANWAYDAVIERIADELNSSQLERELAVWLRTRTCLECGPGLGAVDLRELSPTCRMAFCNAARRGLKSASVQGDAQWQQPEFFPGWITRFEELVKMIDEVDRGEPASTGIPLVEPTGRRVGPGWQMSDEQSDEREPE